MYTELSKIIEGGLNGDREKVYNYSKVLADNLEVSGNLLLAKKIRKIIENRRNDMVSLDSFSSKPVDGESRMEMVAITYPSAYENFLILNKDTDAEILDFIRCYQERDKLIAAGLDEQNCLLLYGPPGCGKTSVAQYISSQIGLPLVTVRLDGLISSLLGSTAKNIRKVFDYASRQECILFLDEFDVIAKVRDDKNEMGELKRVVNSLIQNIDAFSKDSIIIAATNHHELLDPAIWRRFNRVLELNKPSEEDIRKLIRKEMGINGELFVTSSKKLKLVSHALLGMSHADIKIVVNNAKKNSIINNTGIISLYDILRETYLFKNHSITDEEDFLSFLMEHGMTHKELHNAGASLRKVRSVSKARRNVNYDRNASN